MVVARDEILVDVFRRTETGWTSELLTPLDDAIEVSEPPCRLTLAQIDAGSVDALGESGSGPITGE